MPRRRSQPSVASLAAALQEAPRPWPRAQIEARWCRATLSQAVSLGFAVRIAPAQYAHREHAADLGCRLEAVTTWMAPHGCVSGLAALWVRGWRWVEPERIDVALPRDVRLARPPYVDTFRSDDAVVAQTIDGTPVASAADAAILAWRRAAPAQRRGLMLDILRDGPVTGVELERRAIETRRIPDRAQLMALVAIARDGVTSMLEYVAATQVFCGVEWREWERQGEVRVPGGALHPDMVHRRGRLAIELDSARHHGDDQQRLRDLERDALLAAAGYSVIRLTWRDVTRRPEWCRARVREALAARLA